MPHGNFHSQIARPLPESGPQIAGQLATVVRLRLNGAKHRGEEERGYVLIKEVTDQTCRAFHSRTEALIYREKDKSKGSIGAMLGDPFLLTMDERGIFLQGWEVGRDKEGELCQQVQIWLIRPL